MTSLLVSIYSILESFGRARAAAHLANQGHYELAKKLMTEES